MTPLLHSHLVNDRFGDPGLYVGCIAGGWALQLDLGDLGPPRHASGARATA